MVCSYPNSTAAFNDVKICIKKYSLSSGTKTGFRSIYNDVYKDSIKNGIKCSSGICR
jgi:hypothetical protein